MSKIIMLSKNKGSSQEKNMDRIKVIYEDNHLLVLSKPAGILTVPDASDALSLLDWGKGYLKETRNKPGNVFLGVVHRLDRNVSGIVCFAITSKAASRLSDQIRRRQMEKTYFAITSGNPDAEEGCLEHLILKDKSHNKAILYTVDEKIKGAKYSKTCWRLHKRLDSLCFFQLDPVTGRFHQLRAQLASIHCPILGDVKYGAAFPLPDSSIALHAFCLRFFHPTKKEKLILECPFPDKPPWLDVKSHVNF